MILLRNNRFNGSHNVVIVSGFKFQSFGELLEGNQTLLPLLPLGRILDEGVKEVNRRCKVARGP